eukprot:GEMP01008063.1.p1 GENE.GEMP01008063.1~~GEMP01008063.1.p1  ORF type:complete len:782 (+),score=186.41 GEMP01008063.1:124-2469(+)
MTIVFQGFVVDPPLWALRHVARGKVEGDCSVNKSRLRMWRSGASKRWRVPKFPNRASRSVALFEPLAKPVTPTANETATTRYCSDVLQHCEGNPMCVLRGAADAALYGRDDDNRDRRERQKRLFCATRKAALARDYSVFFRKKRPIQVVRAEPSRGSSVVACMPQRSVLGRGKSVTRADSDLDGEERREVCEEVCEEVCDMCAVAVREQRPVLVDDAAARPRLPSVDADHAVVKPKRSFLCVEQFHSSAAAVKCESLPPMVILDPSKPITSHKAPTNSIQFEQSLQSRLEILRKNRKQRRSETRRQTVARSYPGMQRWRRLWVESSAIFQYRVQMETVFRASARYMEDDVDAEPANLYTTQEVKTALISLKLWPKTQEEKRAYDRCVQEVFDDAKLGGDDVGLTLFDFMFLVHHLRADYSSLRITEAKDQFEKFLEPGEEAISEEEIYRMITSTVHLQSRSLFLESKEATDTTRAVLRELMALHGGHEKLEFEDFYVLYQKLELSVQMMKLTKSAQVAETLSVPRQLLHGHHTDLCDLKCMFDECDEDKSNGLSKGEAMYLCAMLGIGCTTRYERNQLQIQWERADADGNGNLDFVDFLSFVSCTKASMADDARYQYGYLFQRFDADNSGLLSANECAMCLNSLNLNPRSLSEQEEFMLILAELHDETSDGLNKDQFVQFIYIIQQTISREDEKEDVKDASALGYSSAETRDMRIAFGLCFTPGALMGAAQLTILISKMKKTVDANDVNRYFAEYFTEHLSYMRFIDFLTLMKHLNVKDMA